MTYFIRTCLNRFPLLKRMLGRIRNLFFSNSSVSSNYVSLNVEDLSVEADRLRDAWHDEALPMRQRELVERQLRNYRLGERIDVFDVFVKSISELPELSSENSLLEIGCSSGFYSEVVDVAKLPVLYAGCDYAPAFIEMARRKYPEISFEVEDATALNYPDTSFDIVVSGCCLLHIPEYKKAVEEVARVSRQYAIFHRTPVVFGMPEQWFRKNAYGVETVEIHFNESEFLALLEKNSLELIATHTLSESVDGDSSHGRACRTYVCSKKVQ